MPFQTFRRRLAALLCLPLLLSLAACATAQTKPTAQRRRRATPAAPSSGSATASSITTTACTGTTTTWSGAGEPGATNRSTSVTISGSGLDWHDMAAYLQPDGIGKYSFVPGNKIVFNPPGRQFDTVIMMDCSQCPVHPQLDAAFHATVKKNAEIITKYGARPVLFMSWAYKDAPEMTAQLAEQYTIAGNANDALVIPAGLAYAKAIARRPELELYQPDKRHPTLAGTYLAACTTYAAIRRKSPVGIKYDAGLGAELATFLQTVAADTVKEYYAR